MNHAHVICVACVTSFLLGSAVFAGGCNSGELVVVENDGGTNESTIDAGTKGLGTHDAGGYSCTGTELSCSGCCGESIAPECTDAGWACPLLGCPASICTGADAAADTGAPDTGPPQTDDGGITLPPECANPGPFVLPTSDAVTAAMVGTWIDCSVSLFTGATPDAGTPSDQDVGVAFRTSTSDAGLSRTWQKLGVSGGQLVGLSSPTAAGGWDPDAANTGEVLLDWSTGSLVVDLMFSTDGRSMYVQGTRAVLAKAVGTP